MVVLAKFNVDTDIRANTNFDKAPLAKDFPIQLNLWYGKNDDFTTKLKNTADELSKANVRFRKDSSKARYTYMCDVYFKDVDTLTAFLKKAMSDVQMVQKKLLDDDKIIYPFMLLDKGREILQQNRGMAMA